MIRRLLDVALGRFDDDDLLPGTADEHAEDLNQLDDCWAERVELLRAELDQERERHAATHHALELARGALRDERARHAVTLRRLEETEASGCRPEMCRSLAECTGNRAAAERVSRVITEEERRG